METIKNSRVRIRTLGVSFLLLGSILFQATTAHAIPVRIDSDWIVGSGGTQSLTTQAFLDTGTITGVGLESVPVTTFDLQFTSNSVVGTAILDPLNPFYLGFGLNAEFLNGQLLQYKTHGSILIAPTTIFSGRFTTTLPGRLEHSVGFGQTNYALQPGSIVTSLSGPPGSVPEPATWLLLVAGLSVVITSVGARRKLCQKNLVSPRVSQT